MQNYQSALILVQTKSNKKLLQIYPVHAISESQNNSIINFTISATFIEEFIVTNGSVLYEYLSQDFKNELINNQQIDINTTNILENLEFFLLNQEQNEDVVPIEPFKLILDQSVLNSFKQLFQKNNQISFRNNLSIESNICFMIFNNPFKEFTPLKISDDIQQSQSVFIYGSPFGIYSSQLFHNLAHRGIISQINNEKNILILDYLTFPGSEGSCVLNEQNQILAIMLSALNLNSSFSNFLSVAIPIHSLLKIDYVKNIKNQFNHSVCLVRYQGSWCSGVVLDKQGHIITVRHIFKDSNDKQIQVKLGKHYFNCKIEKMSKASLDICLLKVTSDLPFFEQIAVPPALAKSITPKLLVQGCGYGIFSPETFDGPMITSGIVSKVIDCDGVQLIQTDSKIFNGYSGGGLFNHQNELCGIIIYNVNFKQQGIINQLNFAYGIQFLSLPNSYNLNNEKIEQYSQLQTRNEVPIFKSKL